MLYITNNIISMSFLILNILVVDLLKVNFTFLIMFIKFLVVLNIILAYFMFSKYSIHAKLCHCHCLLFLEFLLSFYCFPMMPGCAMIIFCSISNKDKKIQGLPPWSGYCNRHLTFRLSPVILSLYISRQILYVLDIKLDDSGMYILAI